MGDRQYPTEDELAQLRAWPLHDACGWLEFARSLWWMQDWGWPELEGEVSTGGWSGNEEIIEAMQEAQHGLLWHQVWHQTRRGGHYTLNLERSRRRVAASRPPGGQAVRDMTWWELLWCRLAHRRYRNQDEPLGKWWRCGKCGRQWRES